MVRTEEDKILRAGMMVILGGKEYEIKPLVIRDAREWRKKLAGMMSKLPQYIQVTTDDVEGFESAINIMMVGMPDEIADLFFAYAKDLNREEIESNATEVELSKAFEAVLDIALPLLGSLAKAMGKLV